MRELQGRSALVTGAASGIGLALARELSHRGVRLALLDNNEEELKEICSELGALAVPCDLRDDTAVATAAASVHAELGPMDLVFANAGVAAVGPTCELDLADTQWVLDVNIMGTLSVLRHFVPPMRQAGRGHIAVTASIAGLIGAPGMAAYTASKFALVGLSESLRVELHGTGVSVTTVCPGYVRTGLHKSTHYHSRDAPYAQLLDNAPDWFGLSAPSVAKRTIDATLKRVPMLTLGLEKFLVRLRQLSLRSYTILAHRASRAAGLMR